ncbi:SURF1 family protein [Albirhodobacter sp. R86504]|uniref:SURF1 family protein n=1 Tax=Albirhodobacter sp. R86504 TaxID=3093848 RepID=UPI00367021A7
MMKKYLFPAILGIVGCAILINLGMWQLRRLAWKEAMLAEISAQINDTPVELPTVPEDPASLKYLPVVTPGATTGEEILMLTGRQGQGAGYEVISAFETGDGRRILVDRGFLREVDRYAERPAVPLVVRGNLHWPEEADSYTPEPDLAAGVWYARDVERMAAHLKTEPILIVASAVEGDLQSVDPNPITITGIKNDHKGYAITWFLLATVWAGMTLLFTWRIRRQGISRRD